MAISTDYKYPWTWYFGPTVQLQTEPQPEGRYRVVEGNCYVFPERFDTWVDADRFAREEAKKNPSTDYTVVYQDTRVRGELDTQLKIEETVKVNPVFF